MGMFITLHSYGPAEYKVIFNIASIHGIEIDLHNGFAHYCVANVVVSNLIHLEVEYKSIYTFVVRPAICLLAYCSNFKVPTSEYCMRV